MPAVRLNPEVPAELERIINKALEKDRDIRYQSAAELRADFERLKRATSSGKVSAVPPSRDVEVHAGERLRWPWVGGTATFLLGIVFAIWILIPTSPPRVTGSAQLTSGMNVHAATPIVTDGPRLYFTESRPAGLVIAQMSANGGDVSSVPTVIKNPFLADISPDRSQLLIGTNDADNVPFWAMPLPSGSPRRIGDVEATWTAECRFDGGLVRRDVSS